LGQGIVFIVNSDSTYTKYQPQQFHTFELAYPLDLQQLLPGDEIESDADSDVSELGLSCRNAEIADLSFP